MTAQFVIRESCRQAAAWQRVVPRGHVDHRHRRRVRDDAGNQRDHRVAVPRQARSGAGGERHRARTARSQYAYRRAIDEIIEDELDIGIDLDTERVA